MQDSIEEKLKLLLSFSDQKQEYIKDLIIRHEANSKEDINSLKAEIIELKARIGVIELNNASARPVFDLLFKILGSAILMGVVYLLGGGRFKP